MIAFLFEAALEEGNHSVRGRLHTSDQIGYAYKDVRRAMHRSVLMGNQGRIDRLDRHSTQQLNSKTAYAYLGCLGKDDRHIYHDHRHIV